MPLLLALGLPTAPAFAQSINLSWNDCGAAGTEIKSFACDINTGVTFDLVGSFVAPAGINQFVGITADLRVAATTLPDWWKIGTGQCRTSAVITAHFDPPSSCADPFDGNGVGGSSYDVGGYGSNTARILIQAALQEGLEHPIGAGTEYSAFRLVILPARTVGSPSCAGCLDPVRITLNSIQLFQPTQAGNDPVLTATGVRSIAYWQAATGSLPAIASFAPAGAAEGAGVTISGTGLTSASQVRFGGVSSVPTLSSDAQVQVPVPAGARTGTLEVATPFGTAASGSPFVVAPTIAQFIPIQAPVGASVRIHGRNFTGVTSVLFGAQPATFSVSSDTEIQTTVPAGASSGSITVTNLGGSDSRDGFALGPVEGRINLSWDDCGIAGQSLQTFACNSNVGPGFLLVGSFVPPSGITELRGVSADLSINSAAPVEWWAFGRNQCQGVTSLAPSFDFAGMSACTDPWGAAYGMSWTYDFNFYGSGHRLRVFGNPLTTGIPVQPDREYYAFKIHIAQDRTGVCAGCGVPATISLQSLSINQSGTSTMLSLPLNDATVYWQNAPRPPPAIASFTPPGGPVGTPVTVNGSHFTGATSVRFGLTPATFTIVSDTRITTSAPAGFQSSPIVVQTLNGTATSATFYRSPDISNLSPPTASVGTTIGILGTGLAGTSSVRFNGTPALFFQNISDAMITAVVPAGATTGPVEVTNPGGVDVGPVFTVGPLPTGTLDLAWDDCGAFGAALKTFACTPDPGPAFPLVISFRPPAGIVSLTKMTAHIRIDSSQLPDWWKHGTGQCRGTGDLAVALSGPTTCPAPWGAGTGFLAYAIGFYGPETAILQVDATPAPLTTLALDPGIDHLGARVLIARTMASGPGSCANCARPVRLNLEEILLTQSDGIPFNPVLTTAATRSTVYWQGIPGPAPVVTATVPPAGAIGAPVSIRGAHLAGATGVRFNGTFATFTVVADTAISTTVPAGTRTGPVSVETLQGVAVSPFPFIVAPDLVNVLPNQAPIGTQVGLIGVNFTGTTHVLFNGTPATFTVDNDSLVRAAVPVGATSGPVTITNPGGSDVSDTPFTIGPITAGIDLSWKDCGLAGVEIQTFACNTNSGTPFSLVGSFRPPTGITEMVGFDAEVRISSTAATLPDWWRHGFSQCRGISALTTSFDFVNGACQDLFPGATGGTQSYAIGYYAPNTARLVLHGQVPPSQSRSLDGEQEYYAFRTSIARTNTVTAACAGCTVPIRLELLSIKLIQNPGVAYDPVLITPLHRNVAYWQAIPGPQPMILALDPVAGAPGSTVTIRGRNLGTTSAVHFHNLPASFSTIDDTTLSAIVPGNARSGYVAVTNANGSTQSPAVFRVTPRIASFSPHFAPIGYLVRIVGVNFGGASDVRFGAVPASFETVLDTLILATVPAGISSERIVVTNPGGSDTSAELFNVAPFASEGVNLSWDDCGEYGVSGKTFACNTNAGSPFTLVASFGPPSGIEAYLGLSAMLTIGNPSGSLPDWWKHGTAACRGGTALSSSFDFLGGPFSCQDVFLGQAAGGLFYQIGPLPSNARLLVQAAIPLGTEGPLGPGVEYYGFKINIFRSRTTGTGSCAGCDVPMCIQLNEIQLFQPDEMNFNPKLMDPMRSNIATWQGASSCVISTPVQVSIVTAEADAGEVRLAWELPRGDGATLYRREDEGEWRRVTRLTPDGQQRLEYVDRDVRGGVTYRYRLGLLIGDEEIFAGETSVTVPVAATALGVRGISWSGRSLSATLVLPGTGGARFDVFDLGGRRSFSSPLDHLGVGEHRVEFAAGLRPGVYFARVTQGGAKASARFVVLQ